MKLNNLKRMSKNLKEGKDFEIFEGIVATIKPNMSRSHKNNIGLKLNKYIQENEVENNDPSNIPEKDLNEISYKALIEEVIIDIKGLQNDDGSELEWSEKVGLEMLRDPDMQFFFDKIITIASSDDNFFELDVDTKKK